MIRIALSLLVALLIGVGVGRYALVPVRKEPKPPAAQIVAEPHVSIDMQSIYSSTVPQLGTLGRALADKISRVTNNSLEINFKEPPGPMSAAELVDALKGGTVESAWITPGFISDLDSTFTLFSGPPFGSSSREYLAWMLRGEGRELQREVYSAQGLAAQPCGILAPRGTGWFRQEIRTLKDLKGLRMRVMGLSARVMEKLGVEAQRIPAGDTFQAFISGKIDAAEISTPAIDLRLGLPQVARNYYFPGWHQQSTMIVFVMAAEQWDALSESHRAAIETVCGDNIRDGLADSEADQLSAIRTLQESGITIRKLPPEVIAGLESAWNAVASEESARNESFRRVLDSFNAVRREYAAARAAGYID